MTSDKNSIVDIQDIFKQILSAQQYKILISRSVKSLTLESLGEHYDLTRERIRQIESTSIKKIVDRFKKPITEFVKKVDEILDDSYGQILLKDCCEVIDANESTIRLLIYISKNIFKRAVKIKDGVISRCSSEENYTEWNSQIDNILFSMRWPIDYKELEDKLTGIPGSYVGHYLHAKRGVIIDDNVIISIKKIPKTVLMTFVLRDEDKAMTPDEVVKKMRNMFGVEMTAHSAGAVLSRMDNALIVARGVYALYESLPISEYILEEIRNDSYKYIIEKQNFISSKVLYQDVFSKKYSKIDILNEYVILGILQDDIRFITKRGLMVGLKDFVHSVEIKPLKEEILELVQQEGPISVTDIQKRLAESRRILFVTINIFLEADERVIRVSPGTYDAVEKVFECKEDYYDLKSAVQIVIVDMPSSLFSIQTKIKTIPSLKKNNINQSIIQSVLRRIDGVKKINGIYSIENINDDIFSYDELIKHAIINNYEIDQINEQAVDIFGEKIAENLMGLDYRLYVASLIQMENSEISNEKDELHSIFEAFGL